MPVCLVPAAAICWDLLDEGKWFPSQTQLNMAIWEKKCAVTSWGRKGMRTPPSRELVIEMNNGRVLRWKEHLPETESWLKAELPKCQQRDPQRVSFGPGRPLNLLDCKARLRERVYCYLMFLPLIYWKLLLSVLWSRLCGTLNTFSNVYGKDLLLFLHQNPWLPKFLNLHLMIYHSHTSLKSFTVKYLNLKFLLQLFRDGVTLFDHWICGARCISHNDL